MRDLTVEQSTTLVHEMDQALTYQQPAGFSWQHLEMPLMMLATAIAW